MLNGKKKERGSRNLIGEMTDRMERTVKHARLPQHSRSADKRDMQRALKEWRNA